MKANNEIISVVIALLYNGMKETFEPPWAPSATTDI